MKLIDKSALVAEIKSRISNIEISQKAGLIKKRDADKEIFLFKNILSLIDTLEVKEVDLEKEIGKYLDVNNIEYGFQVKLFDFAKHFYELGLKVQKGE